MALLGKIIATVIEDAANIFEYSWYCLEDIRLHLSNASSLDNDLNRSSVDGAPSVYGCNRDGGLWKYM